MKANSKLGLMLPNVHLFHSRKKCRSFLEDEMHVKAQFYDTSAQMFYHEGTAVVLMEHVGKTDTELAMLVHEAYHAAIAHMSWLGEDEAGEETMAYLVQSISNGLFVAHDRWKQKQGLVK